MRLPSKKFKFRCSANAETIPARRKIKFARSYSLAIKTSETSGITACNFVHSRRDAGWSRRRGEGGAGVIWPAV